MERGDKKKMGEARKSGLNTTQKIMIVGFICIIAAIGAAAFFIMKTRNQPAAEPVTAGNLLIDDSNLADAESQLEEEVADGMFEVNMNTIWNFPDAKTASKDAYVANGTANRYPISFEILLNGTDLAYTSTVIPVGKQIRVINLDKDLEPGSYDAVCLYHLWNEDGTENSSFGVNVTLNILQ